MKISAKYKFTSDNTTENDCFLEIYENCENSRLIVINIGDSRYFHFLKSDAKKIINAINDLAEE